MYMTGQGEMTNTLGSYLDKRWWMRLLLRNCLMKNFCNIYVCGVAAPSAESTHFQAAPWAKAAMYYNSTSMKQSGFDTTTSSQASLISQPTAPIFLPLGTTFRRRIYILLIGDFELLCSQWLFPVWLLGNGHWEHREPKRLNGMHHLLSK